MRIKILAFGKMGRGPEQQLIDEYIKRLPWAVDIVEFEIKKPGRTAELRKKQEAEKLLGAIPASSVVVALDERGKSCTSVGLSEDIDKWAADGMSTTVFIIGGADGLDESIRKKARLVLGFGTLTWPHRLARVMLVEQIYRAWSIQARHPYHRE